MRFRFAVGLLVAVALQPLIANTKSSKSDVPEDITLGHPRVWGYQRIYPLLDGLFQDVASTQLAQLVLNPNSANAASLQAIQNVLQLAASYSQTTGMQNTLAQQVNAPIAANAALQTQLLGMEGPLIQSAIAAQQHVASAQALVDQLSQSPTATAAQQASAADALKVATDNLNGITSQLSTIKTQLGTISSSTTAFTAPSTNAQSNVPTLPTNLTNLTAPPNAPPTPSFPSSKQMDNQVNLLWERLSRLVSTLAQPDSLTNYGIDLIEFNVSITPANRKKQLLGIQYELSCASSPSCKPIVLDLFPSASAVNIVDTKYRENRVGLAAFLSWFTVGLNASYNRDHLQMSQALGQSAYITGYGVGTSRFGWIFGRNLGDDTITPGNRTVFVLIAVPETQNRTFTVKATRAQWFKDNAESWYKESAASIPDTNSQQATFDVASGEEAPVGSTTTGAADPQNSIKSVAYAPADFDPTKTTQTLVSVAITTSGTIDPQQTVSVNGRFLKRTRDTFGRGVSASGSGSGGVLETSTLDPNSWVPTGSKALLLSLDPSLFGRRFPDIRITTPYESYSATAQLKPKPTGATITVNGREFYCGESCPSDLPALGYPKGTTKQLLVSQWHKIDADEIFLSVVGDSSNAANPNATSAAPPSLQVISGSDQPSWGGDAIVLAKLGDTTYRLACTQAGSRLVCNTPATLHNQKPFDIGFSLEVIDPDHAGGPLHAWQSIPPCDGSDNVSGPSACAQPLVQNLGQPEWRQDSSGLRVTLHLDLVNMKPDQVVALRGGPSNSATIDKRPCPHTPIEGSCSVDLTVAEADYGNVSDQMEIRFGGADWQPAKLLYLRSITQPVLSGINDPQTILTGQNLYFKLLDVGDSLPKPIEMTCTGEGSECRFDKYPAGATGYLYFVTNSARIQVLQVKGTTLTAIYHTAPTPPAGNGAKPAGAAAGAKAGQKTVTPQLPTIGGNAFDLIIKPNRRTAEITQ
jgi:hypothetical protein